jgi:cell division protein FtsB
MISLELVKRKVERYSVFFLVFFCLVLLLSLARNVLRIRKSGLKISEAQQKVDKLKVENQELQQKLSEVTQGDYIEKQLRDKLGMAKEGEIVVVLPDDETLRKLAPRPVEEEETLPDPNWKKWVHLFGF